MSDLIGGNITKKEYIRYFNLEIKFNKMIREYLKTHVLQKNEILDVRPISHSFLKGNILNIYYYITDLSEDFGKRIHTVSRAEFEKIMGFDNICVK